jgi:hypothetical protein
MLTAHARAPVIHWRPQNSAESLHRAVAASASAAAISQVVWYNCTAKVLSSQSNFRRVKRRADVGLVTPDGLAAKCGHTPHKRTATGLSHKEPHIIFRISPSRKQR